MKTDLEYTHEKALEQYVRRRRVARSKPQIDNSVLEVGQAMFFYCKDCGIEVEKLPEDYLFMPINQCSQCKGLEKMHWLAAAKQYAQHEESNE